MIFRVPSYYKEFHCIAGDCQHSCCIGWEVDIDEDTASYYKEVEEPIGEKIHKYLQEDQEEGISYFSLMENGWCPFLNQNKLCDICIALGEEALSEVCTEFPRFVMEYGNVREKILSISCEEVARILFSMKEKATWEEVELPGELELEEEDAEVSSEELERVRQTAVELLQDRTKPILFRAANFLDYCNHMQHTLFGGIATEEATKSDTATLDEKEAFSCFKKRMETFDQLEVLDDTWTKEKAFLNQVFTEENYLSACHRFQREVPQCEVEYEQLLVYLTFRYFMRSYYDNNIIEKAQFAVTSLLMMRDMDAARYLTKGGHYDMGQRIEVARVYSREVEHSEENMELLAEEFQFEELFQVQNLIKQILQ